MKRRGEQIYVLLSSMIRRGRQDKTDFAQWINLYGYMTSTLTVGYQNNILLNFLLTADIY